jgi:hypothetical protein
MKLYSDIQELNDRCAADPARREFWVASEWRSWKHVLRGIGKRKCVAAAVVAIGTFDGPCRYPNFAGTGNLSYETHDRIKALLYASLLNWLTSDNGESLTQIAAALSEFVAAVEKERAKGWNVVCSDTPPVNVLTSLAEAVLARSSFEVHLRNAFVGAARLAPGCALRFRNALA